MYTRYLSKQFSKRRNVPLNRQNLSTILTLRFAFVALALVLFTAFVISVLFGPNSDLVEIDAQITGNQTVSSKPTLYLPEVTYTYQGTEYKAQGREANDKPYTVGDSLVIAVDPSNPADFQQRQHNKWVTLLILAVALLLPVVRIVVKTIRELKAMRKAN